MTGRLKTFLIILFGGLIAQFPEAKADSACGPGQRMVGTQRADGGPAGQGGASFPVCAPDNAAGLEPVNATPEIPLSPLNAVIVWWNTNDGIPSYSYSAGQLTSIGAYQNAMTHCLIVGGQNCRGGITAAGGWLAISAAPDGSLFAAYGAKKKAAEAGALELCRHASGCRIEKTINNRG